jgi:hypothetical protein
MCIHYFEFRFVNKILGINKSYVTYKHFIEMTYVSVIKKNKVFVNVSVKLHTNYFQRTFLMSLRIFG